MHIGTEYIFEITTSKNENYERVKTLYLKK